MQEFLLVSAVLSWVAIFFNLILGLALLRRLRDVQIYNNRNLPFPNILEIGSTAPDFSVETLDGKTSILADYKNQESLMVFVSPTCIPCREQMPKLKELFPRLQASGIQFLLVSLAGKTESRAFIDEYQMPGQ